MSRVQTRPFCVRPTFAHSDNRNNSP
jgi:hypothetical protein